MLGIKLSTFGGFALTILDMSINRILTLGFMQSGISCKTYMEPKLPLIIL